jgi:hypothetical protein
VKYTIVKGRNLVDISLDAKKSTSEDRPKIESAGHGFLYKKARSLSRIQYEAEVDVIKKQIGDIETVREKLGLSARKMTQLLLVDPSAWNRWTTRKTPPPPHIYRALQWYLALQEKNEGFTPQFFLSTQTFSRNESQKEMLAQLKKIENRYETESSERQKLEKRLELHKRWIQILIFLVLTMALVTSFSK